MRCPHCGAETASEARFCGVCGRAATGTEPSYKDLTGAQPVQAPELIGREIGGRYRVLAKLGEGGMGAVYKAEQISLKRTIAIKVLRPELSRDPGLVRRFNAEAELAAKLSHPHTVNIYDFGQDADGALFIAMEFLEGRSLRQAMTQEGPLPPGRTLAIAQQIAASLADAHRHGIVHRDLKPDNVMLTARGKDKDVVRVLDFGIAKLRDDNRQTVNAMTRAGDLVGTPQYMAPEQIRGESVDGRTDVYALGAMLYEMLTGRLPFEGPTVMAILSKHLIDHPDPPTVRRPDLGLPPALDLLVMAALAKDPAHRPPTMERLGDDLAALAATLPMAHASTGAGLPGPAAMAAAAAAQPPSVMMARPMVPSGPPPGVPRTYPPGIMRAPPEAAPPSYGGGGAGPYPPMPAAPMPMMAPPVAMPPAPTPAPYAAMPRPRSRAPLYAALALVVVAGGGAAAYFATRPSSSADAGGGRGSVDPDDPWSGGTPANDHGPAAPPPSGPSAPAAAAWTDYHDELGWGLRLPPGVLANPMVNDGATNFTGLQDGAVVTVGVVIAPNQGNTLSTAQLDQFVGAYATNLGATVTESGYVVTQGVKRYHAVMASGRDRAEARFFIEPQVVVMAYYGRNDGWDDKAGERRDFFEGVTLPAGGGN